MVSTNRLTKWANIDVTTKVLASSAPVLNLPSIVPAEVIAIPTPDPVEFQDPESFRDSYWRAEVWSKFPFEIEGIDRDAEAYSAAREAERRCASSNQRLADLWSRPIPERYRSILRRAQSLLEHLFAGFTLDEVVEHVGWGPGATTSMRRAQATPQNKWVLGAHMTERCLPYYYAFQQWCGWIFSPPIIVEGNTVTTVPKNAKTNRVIAIEPDWNMFFQLGLGRAIRRRLRHKFGVLQPWSGSVNSQLAKAGSIDGFLATIDLKAASDTVSLALVEALIPHHVS